MPGLIDLKTQVEASRPAPAPTPTPAPPISGDELMAKASGFNQVNNEEERTAKLFRDSHQIVSQRMDSDPEYAKTAVPEFQAAQKKGIHSYYEKMIDEADRVKIQYLQKENPEWFTGEEAAKFGFFNSASFGQLTKIMGKAGELLQGRPYEEVVSEQAEKMRLLQKAYPGSFRTGDVMGYLMPGSPAKALFEKAAGLGVKALGTLIPKIVSNRSLLATIGKSAAAGGSGTAAVGGVSGTLGSDLESFSLDRGEETALAAGLGGALVGATIPAVVRGVQSGARFAAPYVRAGAEAVQAGVGKLAGELSGVPAEALRAYNQNAAKIGAAYGSESRIGGDLVDTLQTHQFSQLPEVAKANQILSAVPDTDAAPMLKFLKSAKAGLDPKNDSQVQLLQEWVTRIENHLTVDSNAKGPIKVNSSGLREVIDDIQGAVRNQYGKDAPFAADILKQAGRIGRLSIVNTAKTQGGEAGALYAQLMEKAAEKRDVLKFVSKQLGSDQQTQAKRAEGFISGLFGKNKELVQQRMQELDSQFGTNFFEQAQHAQYAKQLGSDGIPTWTSASPTGRSSLATNLGRAIGGGIGAIQSGAMGAIAGGGVGGLVGSVAGSPRTAAAILGTSDAITGFMSRVTENPLALARIAGKLVPLAAAGDQGAAKELARLRPPMQVQRLAGEIYTALIKDGPVSAASMTRVIADTPYFFPLAHYYELASRTVKSRDLNPALMQGASGGPQIATPRGQ